MSEIGVIGAGFVGGAIIRAFSGYSPITVYDKGKDIGSLQKAIVNSDVIFVCLPSPEAEDGDCDTSIIEETLEAIHKELRKDTKDPEVEVVIKSTVPPKFFAIAQKKYPGFNLLFMPEFLTARTADLDFINAPRHIIGCEDPANRKLFIKTVTVFRKRFPKVPMQAMTWEAAAMVKYVTNSFFVTKVSFFNEVHEICEKMNIDSAMVIGEVLNDGRIGRSHFQVPGPDGKLGFGGACFPKDSAAFIKIAEELGCPADIVKAAKKVNKRVR